MVISWLEHRIRELKGLKEEDEIDYADGYPMNGENMTNNFLNVFPTLIALDLDPPDNDVLKGKMDVAGNINLSLENGISSYVGGEDCFSY